MKTLTQTIILSSAIFAATAFASVDGLNPSIHSTENNMVSPSSVMTDQNHRFTGIYESVLSNNSTERHLGQGLTVGSLSAPEFCLTSGLSVALNEHSVENQLGGKQC